MASSALSIHPRLTLRVAVTGHYRADRLPDGEVSRVAEETRAVLAQIAGAVAALVAKPMLASAYSAEPPCLRVISPLAERADRIVATEALAAGWQLEALLPFPPEEYQKDFTSEKSKTEFRSLLARAKAACSLATPAAPRPREDGYVSVGRMILDQCDIVLALWDGAPAQGPGGTPEVVMAAQHRGLPVIWIHTSDARRGPQLFAANAWQPLATSGRDAALFAEVLRRITPPFAVEGGQATESGVRVGSYVADLKEKNLPQPGGLAWWHAYARLVLLIARFGARAAASHGERAPEPLPPPPDQLPGGSLIGGLPPAGPLTDTLRDRLVPRYEKTDQLATRIGHIYRSAYVLNFIFAALAVVTGLLAVFWWESFVLKLVCIVLESVWIVLVLLLTYFGRTQHWHERWLDARRIAELLRPAPFLAIVGRGANAPWADASDPGAAWTAWYARASLRELGLPHARVDEEFLRAAIDATVGTVIDPQINYHHGNYVRLSRLHHGLDRIGQKLFWTTLWSGMSFVPFALYLLWTGAHGGLIYEVTKFVLKPVVTLFSAGLPALGAAAAGIRAQGEFQASAFRSRRTQEELRTIRAKLLAARDKPDFWPVRELLIQAAEAMTADLDAWDQLYRNRPIQLPV